MALAGPIQQEKAMALQFLVGFVVSAINIMIHALVTVGAVGIARSAGLRHTKRPRLHLMAVMVSTAAALMVAHTLEVFVWVLAYAIVDAARRQRSGLFRLRKLHHAWLRRYHACASVATDRSDDRNNGILMFGWSTAVLFEVLRKTLERFASIGAPGLSSADRS